MQGSISANFEKKIRNESLAKVLNGYSIVVVTAVEEKKTRSAFGIFFVKK